MSSGALNPYGRNTEVTRLDVTVAENLRHGRVEDVSLLVVFKVGFENVLKQNRVVDSDDTAQSEHGGGPDEDGIKRRSTILKRV